MGYVVLRRFADLEDCIETKSGAVSYIYEVGDDYPRERKSVNNARLEELAGSTNKTGAPLIAEVKEEKSEKVQRSTARRKKATK